MNLTTNLVLNVLALATHANDLSTPSDNLSYEARVDLANGTAASQANVLWSDQRTLSAGANETLDLNGVLKDAFGDNANFTRVKALVIVNNANITSANATLSVGGAAANAVDTFFGNATHTVNVRPGGFMALAAPDATGYAVTASTADQLKLENLDGLGSLTYSIIIVGASA